MYSPPGAPVLVKVAAGPRPAGVRALTILNGQGEEILRVLRALGGDAGRQDHGAAVSDDDGSVGLLGHFASFEGHALAVELDFYSMGHTKNCPRVSAGIRRTPCGADAEAARSGAPGFIPSEDRSVKSSSAVNGGCRACL